MAVLTAHFSMLATRNGGNIADVPDEYTYKEGVSKSLTHPLCMYRSIIERVRITIRQFSSM